MLGAPGCGVGDGRRKFGLHIELLVRSSNCDQDSSSDAAAIRIRLVGEG